MAKDMAIAVGGGLASAGLYLVVMADTPFALLLAYLALLPLFVIGLGWGTWAGAVAAVTAALVLALVASPKSGLVFALAYAVPAVLMVRLALRARRAPDGSVAWYSIGALVAWLAIYACGSFTLLALLGGDSEVSLAITQLEELLSSVLPGEQQPQAATLARVIAGYFPAIMIASWLIMALVNAALAQVVLERSSRNLRPRPQAATIELPEWYTAVTAGAAALALLAPQLDLTALGFAARNSALALLVPYFFVGLAVVHVWARRWPTKLMILVGFYLFVVLFGGFGMLLVAGLGFMEQWLDLRRRFAASGSQEDEQ
jgi:hypothetical protein